MHKLLTENMDELKKLGFLQPDGSPSYLAICWLEKAEEDVRRKYGRSLEELVKDGKA